MFASHSLTIKSGQCVSETHLVTVGTLLSKITFNTELTSMKNIKKRFTNDYHCKGIGRVTKRVFRIY